jgi:non-specific serine/threonine protein kinase
VLASSREPLGIGGEFPYRMPSLSLPDSRDRHEMHHPHDLDTLRQYEAVRLFVERAQVAEPRFALTERNAAAVADVCRRLDGIPLAIELAAARVRVLSVEQIDARLDDRFRLLTGGSRTAMPRQQTLQAAMDWSYDLLSTKERVLLQRLSVFMGGWSLEAAEAICAGIAGDSGDVIGTFEVLDLLSRLVDKSLVMADQLELRLKWTEPGSLQEPGDTEAVRYRLLETIRQYAADRLLEAGAIERVRDRHLDFFLKFAEEMEPKLVGPGAKAGLDRVEAQHDNLRAALEWSLSGNEGGDVGKALRLAGALGNFWYWRGYLNEGRHWLERAINIDDSATKAQDLSATLNPDSEQVEHAMADRSRLLPRGKALLWAGTVAWVQADYELAPMRLEESVLLLRQFGDIPNLAQALHILGHAVFDQGDYVGARTFFEESLSLFRELGHKVLRASLIGDLGTVAYYVGDYPTAHHLLDQSISEFRKMPAAQALPLPRMLVAVGDLARSEGDLECALELYETAVTKAREAGTQLTAMVLHRLGQMAHHIGDQARANSLLKESLTIHRDVGDKPGMAECIVALAGVSASEGRFERAARLFGAGTALLERIKVPLSPADREQYDADLASARSQSDGQVLDMAWDEGRAMSMEETIEHALQES